MGKIVIHHQTETLNIKIYDPMNQREIIFRGLTASNKWVEGDLITGMGAKHGKMYILPHVINVAYLKGCDPIDGYNVKPESIGQFCGLHDKHGKRIFEGDILKYKSRHPKHDGKCFNNVVEFAQGQSLCGWRMRNKSTIVKATPFKFSSSEIIGNIHTNPELL